MRIDPLGTIDSDRADLIALAVVFRFVSSEPSKQNFHSAPAGRVRIQVGVNSRIDPVPICYRQTRKSPSLTAL